jgi:hypothetical protein
MTELRIAPESVDKAIGVHKELGARYGESLQMYKGGASVEDADKPVRKINSTATEAIEGLSKVIEERGDQIVDEIVKSAATERTRIEYELLALALIALLASAGAGWAWW